MFHSTGSMRSALQLLGLGLVVCTIMHTAMARPPQGFRDEQMLGSSNNLGACDVFAPFIAKAGTPHRPAIRKIYCKRHAVPSGHVYTVWVL